jgi:hypothetical protein
MRYAEMSRKEQKCQDLTNLTVEEFKNLVPVFEEAFQEYMRKRCLDGKERVGGYVTYANCPLPTAADRLLFILIYVKTNNLQLIHGELFGMSQGKANQWIHVLLPVLQLALRKLGDMPARSMEELACRLGKPELPAKSTDDAFECPAHFDNDPKISDHAGMTLDRRKRREDLAPEDFIDFYDCFSHSREEKTIVPLLPHLPFFVMMGQKGGFSGQKMMRNKKSTIVERKRLTR